MASANRSLVVAHDVLAQGLGDWVPGQEFRVIIARGTRSVPCPNLARRSLCEETRGQASERVRQRAGRWCVRRVLGRRARDRHVSRCWRFKRVAIRRVTSWKAWFVGVALASARACGDPYAQLVGRHGPQASRRFWVFREPQRSTWMRDVASVRARVFARGVGCVAGVVARSLSTMALRRSPTLARSASSLTARLRRRRFCHAPPRALLSMLDGDACLSFATQCASVVAFPCACLGRAVAWLLESPTRVARASRLLSG